VTLYPEYDRLPGEAASDYLLRLISHAKEIGEDIDEKREAVQTNRDDVQLCKLLGIGRDGG
jgi:hypothetical protein